MRCVVNRKDVLKRSGDGMGRGVVDGDRCVQGAITTFKFGLNVYITCKGVAMNLVTI